MEVPFFSGVHERFRTVGQAVRRLAKISGANIEIRENVNVPSVNVYYKYDETRQVALYSDLGRDWSEIQIFNAIIRELNLMQPLHQQSILQFAEERCKR